MVCNKEVLFYLWIAAIVVAVAEPRTASASLIPLGTSIGNSGSRSAQADFAIDNDPDGDPDTVGFHLVITLTNTSTYSGSWQPTDVLTGLFFDVVPDQPFSAANPFAVVATGSKLIDGTGAVLQNSNHNITAPSSGGPTANGWGYVYSSAANPIENQIVGTAGFNLLPGDTAGNHPWNYGIVSSSFTSSHPKVGDTITRLVKDTAELRLIFDADHLPPHVLMITNIRFQYGTTLSEPNFPGDDIVIVPGDEFIEEAPEPTSLALASFAGVTMLIGAARRRRAGAA